MPHWRVRIYPLAESKPLSVEKLGELIFFSQVRLRGWAIPYLNMNTMIINQTSISCPVDIESKKEFWRFFSTGQFLFLRVAREVFDENWQKRLAENSPAEHLADATIPCLDFVNIIYTVTEIYEFLSRLNRGGLYTSGAGVEISIENIHGYYLSSAEKYRGVQGRYPLNQDSVRLNYEYSDLDLKLSPQKLAMDVLRGIFLQFKTMVPDPAIADIQEQFLQPRYRK